MMTKKKWLFTLIIMVLAGGLFFYKREITPPLTSASSITAKKGLITEKVVAVGSIIPQHTISVKSMNPGIIGNIFHEEGDYVEQGALLLQVTPAPTPQSVAEAYGSVKELSAIVLQAKAHQKRIEKLVKLKLETQDKYENVVKELATAKARLEMAQQKLALMQKGETTIAGQNIKTTIVSPISGYILKRNVDVGDPVVPLTEAQAGTVLFVIANMQDLIFKGTVNEIDVAKIKPGMLANINIAALPESKITGTLSKVGLQSNNQDSKSDNQGAATTITNNSPFNVGFNVELQNLQLPKDMKLRSGYSATAEITIKQVKDALIIPERLLIFKDNKVYINLPDKNKQAKLKEQEITLGLSDGINVEVLTGLQEGQEILDNNKTIS